MKYNNESLEYAQIAIRQLNDAYVMAMNAYDNLSRARMSSACTRVWHLAQLLLCEYARIKGIDND